MDTPIKPETSRRYRPRRAALGWVDFLMIAATVLVFAAVVSANRPAARSLPHITTLSAGLPAQPEQMSGEIALIKVKIGLTTAGL